MRSPPTSPWRRLPSACALLLLAAPAAFAQTSTGKPSAVVVLLGESALTGKEVEQVLNTAIAEMRASSGYELDALRSLQAGEEATSLACGLEYDCLLRVGQSAQVDAVLGVMAVPEGRKTMQLELLWVASDARGLPGESASRIGRNERELEAALRAGVKKIIPDYARKGVGGLTVLAEAGAEILIDGQVVGTAPLDKPLVVSAGVHRVDIVTPSRATASKSVEVAEARRQVVDLPSPTEVVAALSEAPPPPPGKALKTASFVIGGAGALAVAGGLFFGIQSVGQDAQLRDGLCRDTPCTAGLTQTEAQQLYERGSTNATVGNVATITGGLMMAGAGLMYWLATREDE